VLVGNEGPVLTTDLGKIAQKLYPQYQMQTPPTTSPTLLSALWYIAGLPLIGSYILSDFQRNYVWKRFSFDNSKTRRDLHIQFHTLDEMIKASVDSMIHRVGIKPRAKL
jgi:hypothetical protein